MGIGRQAAQQLGFRLRQAHGLAVPDELSPPGIEGAVPQRQHRRLRRGLHPARRGGRTRYAGPVRPPPHLAVMLYSWARDHPYETP